MRRTVALSSLALALMADPGGQHWGYDLSRSSGLRSGVLYPILQRLLDAGWLEDDWEQIDRSIEKRPPRRFYKITALGARELGAIAASARDEQPAASRSLGVRLA